MTHAVTRAGQHREDALLPIYDRLPVRFVRARGVELFDEAGHGYLDLGSGFGVNALGHGDRQLARAMREAARTGLIHASNLYHSDPARALAESLVARSFASRVFFCNSGAEANEAAFKFARRWARTVGGPTKSEIVALRSGTHGRLFASLAATDRPERRAPFRPLAAGISVHDRDLRSLAAALDADTVAAVIVEPVQGDGGVRVLDDEFLLGLRDLTATRHIALIFDEVQCGLGRTGWLFAHQRIPVEPDIMTLAKALGGGLPMGAVLLAEPVASTVRRGDHGTTFGGGPFVAAVARHVVERVADPSFLAAVRDNGEWFGERLRAVAARTERLRHLRGVGYMWGADVIEPATTIMQRAVASGLLVLSAGRHTLRFLPPLTATRDDLARGLDILERIL